MGDARRYAGLATAVVLMAVLVADVSGQATGTTPRQLEGTGVQEHLGDKIPTGIPFQDAQGHEVLLGDYLDGERPVVLTLVYHECPMLCPMVLNGLTQTLRQMDWTPGDQFDIVTVSFNPRETPTHSTDAKQMQLEMLGRPEAATGWHFLTGSEASIQALTESVGFQFRWIEEEQTYAHPSTLIFLGGDGTVSRYLHGIEYKPSDVRTALVEASQGKVGSPVDQVLLYCFQYDPNANSYVPHALNLMKLGGGLTVLLLGSLLLAFWRRESNRSRQ